MSAQRAVFLSFEMEKRGAEVVSFDRANVGDWQMVPFSAKGFDVAKMQANMERMSTRVGTATGWHTAY